MAVNSGTDFEGKSSVSQPDQVPSNRDKREKKTAQDPLSFDVRVVITFSLADGAYRKRFANSDSQATLPDSKVVERTLRSSCSQIWV
jgi:hypothetical protein